MSRFNIYRQELIADLDKYIEKAGSKYRLARMLGLSDNYIYQQRGKGGLMTLINILERCDELKWEDKK